MVLWSKWHRPGGHRVYEAVIVPGLFITVPWACMQCEGVAFPGHTFLLHCFTYSENIKTNFLSETTRPRAMIFGI